MSLLWLFSTIVKNIECKKVLFLDISHKKINLNFQDYLDEEIPFNSYFVEGRFFDHVGHFSSLGGTKKLNPLSE